MTFHFNRKNAAEIDFANNVLVHVSWDNDLGVLKADVDMDSLPLMKRGGNEVVAMFELKSMRNEGIFYTDSNGLEMQKRILNYRPTWNLEDNYKQLHENVTANFYPINSAITMFDQVDGQRQFTVMNDRAQSGTSLVNGGIQFIQQRREFDDDGRGESIALDERDKEGHGIRVPATYYIDIANNAKKGQESKQRQVQQRSDNPVQAFYTFDL